MKSLTFFCALIIASVVNGQGYFAPGEEEEIILSPYARTRFVRGGYGGGDAEPAVVAAYVEVDQKPLQPIDSLPNYGGGGGSIGIDQGFNSPHGGQPGGGFGGQTGGGYGGGGKLEGGFGGQPGGSFGGQSGGFNKPAGGLSADYGGPSGGSGFNKPAGGQSLGYGGSSGSGFNQPLVNPHGNGGGRPHQGHGNGNGHRKQNSYGGGNGGAPISFGGSGSYGSPHQGQGGRPAGNFHQPQVVNPGYGGSGSVGPIGGGSHSGVDSYSQPPVIPQGGGWTGPALVAPPQKAPVSTGGYGR